jgi:hypothetical protein
MSTLLILGSKPDPNLPCRSSYDEVACANASGFSAARHGLPTPAFTVMSAVLASGLPSGKQSLQALAGLKTTKLYFFPRPARGRTRLKKTMNSLAAIRTRPYFLKRKLQKLNYDFSDFIAPDWYFYDDMIKRLCDRDGGILETLARKQPSTGIIAVALGISLERYQRFIISGFSFELTHSYAANPEIEQRGTSASRHAATDIAVMSYLSGKFGNIFTTEKVVSECAGLPLFSSAALQVS